MIDPFFFLFCFLFPFKTARRLISLTQSALGLQDLGQLHYQPLKDSQGTLVISTTCHLANIKAVPSSLNFKWLPLSKLQQRRVVTNEESTASDLLLASLQVSIPQWSHTHTQSRNLKVYIQPKEKRDVGCLLLAIRNRIEKQIGSF